jgi:methylenetetrahydrofolate reductase (NADPH)
MSLIRDIFAAKKAAGRPAVSFEFFPTKTPEGERTLLEKTIPALGALQPDFCSVTYGAGGSTREKTLAIVDRIQREQHLTAMAHMTCVNATREETAAVLAQGAVARHPEHPGTPRRSARRHRGIPEDRRGVRVLARAGALHQGERRLFNRRRRFPGGHIACTDGKHSDGGT